MLGSFTSPWPRIGSKSSLGSINAAERILLDEGVPRRVRKFLEEKGFDVVQIGKEYQPGLSSSAVIKDPSRWGASARRWAALITNAGDVVKTIRSELQRCL